MAEIDMTDKHTIYCGDIVKIISTGGTYHNDAIRHFSSKIDKSLITRWSGYPDNEYNHLKLEDKYAIVVEIIESCKFGNGERKMIIQYGGDVNHFYTIISEDCLEKI